MFNREVLAKMKKGAFLVNNARGAIVEVDAIKEACESGQLGGTSRVVTQLWWWIYLSSSFAQLQFWYCLASFCAGYSGDVWYPQPPPEDHSWRYMSNQAMTPHISGTTIDAQARYAQGVREMLEEYFAGKPLPEKNYIVQEGELAEQYK